MVDEAAPFLGKFSRGFLRTGVKLEDQVLQVPAATGDGVEEEHLVLFRVLDGDGGELDDLFQAHFLVRIVIAGDGGDHRGLRQAAGDVCRDGKRPERPTDVQDASVSHLPLLLDEVHDLGGCLHDVPLVNPDDGDFEKRGEFALHLFRDFVGDAFPRAVVIAEHQRDALDREFPVTVDRLHQPVLVMADEDDMRVCH